MKLNIARITPIGFGEDQIEATNRINKFLNDPDEYEFTLSGSAGTGKTHMLKWIVNNLCNFPVCPTAPTHKAVRVIEKTLNRKGKTLQSLHGMRPNMDLSTFSISNPKFDPKGIEHIKSYKLVIIDEASMITDSIYELNKSRAKQYGTKILYVGDHLQHNPIQTSKAKGKVFTEVKNKYTLNKIMRQEEGNPLLELFPLIREDIIKGTSKFLEYIFLNRSNMIDNVGYKLLPENKFNDELDEYFELNRITTDLDYARVIAYTNKMVGVNNQYIRNKLLDSPKDILVKQDILTSYTTFVDEFNYPIIINSEDYYINTIRPYVNHLDIKTYAINLQSAFDGRLTNTIQVVDHTDKSFATYYKILNHLHKEATSANKTDRGSKWKAYFKFKESILCMISFPLDDSNNNQIVKKDIDYAYSITSHKSQGSTFKNVFIDLRDMLYYQTKTGKYRKRFDMDMVNRLIYVAMSRASNKVIMKL